VVFVLNTLELPRQIARVLFLTFYRLSIPQNASVFR